MSGLFSENGWLVTSPGIVSTVTVIVNKTKCLAQHYKGKAVVFFPNVSVRDGRGGVAQSLAFGRALCCLTFCWVWKEAQTSGRLA